MSYRPWRITLSVQIDREAYNATSAEQQAREVARQLRGAITTGVGGTLLAIEIENVDLHERRTGTDRRGQEQQP